MRNVDIQDGRSWSDARACFEPKQVYNMQFSDGRLKYSVSHPSATESRRRGIPEITECLPGFRWNNESAPKEGRNYHYPLEDHRRREGKGMMFADTILKFNTGTRGLRRSRRHTGLDHVGHPRFF